MLKPDNRALLRFELLRDEGFRATVYKDSVGKRTIGIGRNLDRKAPALTIAEENAIGQTRAQLLAGAHLTRIHAMYLLDNDIKDVEQALLKALPWVTTLDEVRQRALINMAFNMGVKTLLTFKNTLGCIQRREFTKAAVLMLQSKWADQVGDRAVRIAKLIRLGTA